MQKPADKTIGPNPTSIMRSVDSGMAETDKNSIACVTKYAGGHATSVGQDIPPSVINPGEVVMTLGQQKEVYTGPLRILTDSVENNTQVLINCRKNKKLLGRVRAFDEHFNMVLEEVKEMWTELPIIVRGKKQARPVHKDRFISKMFLRGDTVVLINKMGVETWTKRDYPVADNMMIGSKDTETEQLDERDGEKYLLSTASTGGPELEAAPTEDLRMKPIVPHDSQMPRISESREQ